MKFKTSNSSQQDSSFTISTTIIIRWWLSFLSFHCQWVFIYSSQTNHSQSNLLKNFNQENSFVLFISVPKYHTLLCYVDLCASSIQRNHLINKNISKSCLVTRQGDETHIFFIILHYITCYYVTVNHSLAHILSK